MRTLTQQHKDRMARARARAREVKHERERRQITAYRRWVAADAAAYQRFQFCEAIGEGAKKAHADWLRVLRSMPPAPPDSAWRRERGEDGGDETLR